MNKMYVVLDAARMGDRMNIAKALNIMHESLFKGNKKQVLPGVAPYLFTFRSGSNFAKWIKEEGVGDSWGIFIASSHNFKEVHRHLRRFLMVKDERGKSMYFRFYDPRVLRLILPTFDVDQLKLLFDKIDSILVEDEEIGFYHNFRFYKEKLKTERFKL